MLKKLVLQNIKKNITITVISIITLVVTIFTFTFIDFTFSNIKNIWIKQSGWNNKNKVVITKKYQWFLKSIINKDVLESAYKDIKKNTKISKSYAFYSTKIPSSAVISFMWFNFDTDILIYATDKIKNDKDELKLWISPTILNIYNTQVSNELFPKLNKDNIKWIKIKINFWKNSFFSLKNKIEKNAVINYIDDDFPLLWFVISKDSIDDINKHLWINKVKIYKIVFVSNDKNIVDKLKKMYPSLNIRWYNDLEEKIDKKLKPVKYVFNFIKMIIYTILIWFIIILSIIILQNNKNNIKVLYYNGASRFKQFFLILWEISTYVVISSIIVFLGICFINANTNNINQTIEKNGFINIKIKNISNLNLLQNVLIIYFSLVLISYIFFLKINFNKPQK